MTIDEIRLQLRKCANPTIAAHSLRFFKTGPGEYGEGDRFLGIRVPVLRKLARQCSGESLKEVENLLQSPWHEERLFALLRLVRRFETGPEAERRQICNLYLDNTRFINNWDLVDSSAHRILGPWLMERDRGLLHRLAGSDNLWERRIAVMATLHFIRHRQFDDTLKIACQLLDDTEDLIHKAVGWMLREIGKREQTVSEAFLHRHYRQMPRTMLRYAIERFPEPLRKQYLKGLV
jgi:3-methyladenine DNA glycosylase AlkD